MSTIAQIDNELENLIAGKDDEEAGLTLAALLTSAVNDEHPQYSLQEIKNAVVRIDAVQKLESLSAIPLLIRCRDRAAEELLALLGECGNAKENLIAIQEAVEYLIVEAQNRDEEEEEVEAKEDGQGDQGQYEVYGRLTRVLALCTSTIPRLKLRKKSPAETIQSCFTELETLIELATPSLSRTEGRAIIGETALLMSAAIKWVRDQVPDETSDSLEPARSLLLSALTSLEPHINAELAQRFFEVKYSRLVIHSEVNEDYSLGIDAMSGIVGLISSLWPSTDMLLQERSIGALILFAHGASPSIPPNKFLSATLSLLISSIRSNTALDETLFILLSTLLSLQTSNELLSFEIAPMLCSLLAPLSSSHPSPSIRHIAFRILSLVLSCSPPIQRMHLLHDLLTESAFPQMRVAAVGLFKDAVLEALNDSTSNNPFGSPLMLQLFGPIVFRPDPPDLFDSMEISLETFMDAPESKRLVECLAFYYVLIMRDKNNVTGIRDEDEFMSIEKGLLSLLRVALQRWMRDAQGPMDIMPLAALVTSLERVDAAVADIRR